MTNLELNIGLQKTIVKRSTVSYEQSYIANMCGKTQSLSFAGQKAISLNAKDERIKSYYRSDLIIQNASPKNE